MPRKAQGVKVPTGLPYGGSGKLARAQQALPLPNAALPPTGAASAPAPGAPTTGAGGGGGLAGALADLQQMAPMAPLQGGTDVTMPNVARPITTMPTQQEIPLNVIRFLPALEAAAAAPGSSWATRQAVRRLRAGLPPGVDMADPNIVGG